MSSVVWVCVVPVAEPTMTPTDRQDDSETNVHIHTYILTVTEHTHTPVTVTGWTGPPPLFESLSTLKGKRLNIF